MEELLQNVYVQALVAILGTGVAGLWWLVPMALKWWASKEIEKVIDYLYHMGNKKNDVRLTRILRDIDEIIPDDISATHPEVIAAAGGNAKKADLYAALLIALNDKAKERSKKK